MNALRWLAVVPAFLATALVVGCGVILLLYTVSSLAIFKWGVFQADEYLSFWRSSDMNGAYLSGTFWLLIPYMFASYAAMSVATRVAPIKPVRTAKVLTGAVALVLAVGLIVSLATLDSFSSLYRALAEAIFILLGCLGGIKDAADRYGY